MKIFLPFESKGIGGTSVFAERFRAGMEKYGHEVFFEYRPDYDVIFLIVQGPFQYLIEAKRKGKKIIQRLDGTYYWSVASWKYPLYNLKAGLIRHFFADFTIYQSQYSRYCAEKFLGRKRSDPSSMVYNGVDLNLFSPEGKILALRDNPEQQIFFTSSVFRREDQIVPILEALKIYKKRYGDNFKFLIAGTFVGKAAHIPKKYAEFQQTVFLGRIDNVDLPAYERSADVFLITHLNPPCPNNVIEALASGLPICGVNDGSMSELVEHGRNGLLLETSGDAFWTTRTLDLDQYAENIRKLSGLRSTYSSACRKRAETLFSIETMLEGYKNAVEKISE